ncbi:Anaphase-promoting complex subunit 4 WD40 domain-containing protein [Plasmodiophora brassicae]|uniref:Anaphase-promoting complex subunit 4 WD40 domain-containing protein n=1 Tax=Plasmodiophora brassicae TaxID=37360 RepID=A0A0G4IJP5_PLABS|nr:hypothetical protein PBRA_004068 [Plasmodiophora brassicae]SPQ96251.1 unnamed protein product [Plasmodiophora brassicae]
MDFSEPFKVSSEGAATAKYSPCGSMLATADEMRVTVRDADTLEVVDVCECCDIVQHIEWSPDSKLLMCVQLLRARVWVFPIGQLA